MRRRDLLTLIGGALATTPRAARAQQGERARRLGVLIGAFAKDDPEAVARVAALKQALLAGGWIDGRNLRIDYRWTEGDTSRVHQYAAQLVERAPDVILVEGSLNTGTMLQVTRTIPIVFANIVDPVGSGYIASLAHPGGNATGFTHFDYSVSGKWLELLREIAPGVTRAAVVRDPRAGPGIGQFAVIQAVAPSQDFELVPINAIDAAEIERGIVAFARSPNSGLVVTAGGVSGHRNLVIALAARYRLPAIYPFAYYVTSGGLASYGPNSIDPTRRAAAYIDRILKGEKPGDLPVQAPTKYELAINLKTAKALSLTIPQSILLRADEVIE